MRCVQTEEKEIFFLCLAPELSEETFPTLLLISKLMKVKHTNLKSIFSLYNHKNYRFIYKV